MVAARKSTLPLDAELAALTYITLQRKPMKCEALALTLPAPQPLSRHPRV
jgi:hypothetical protein